MDRQYLKDLLQKVKNGTVSIEEALDSLKVLKYEDLGFAKVDHHRNLRNGFPEVIFAQGKTPEQVVAIFAKLAEKNKNVLATRASQEMYEAVKQICPQAVYHPAARCITLRQKELPKRPGSILVISAGTADLPVAEEAAVTGEIMGNTVLRLYDVGVAGIHRLLDNHQLLSQASVIIVVAGMEGALASVVGGLVDKPVLAVPTSVGYGASFGGIAALLGMLNSCAAGVAVFNIDNGFGAAAMASSILRLKESSA
ncbi:nickel pincer cofactor biosynthesis protein LarB [Thermincola potens]|uniref:1-(5-phosphoribosyl)-5-amino-4-imidazole-carboxylate (AIR) carboxylase n=1 Tax=Thermincola potens (strain JR) TaxID=635013 RepID=D5XDT3_THEPJ|nr:nickel pincer cofactor biosynthesis protein LarB [Thermincola potens]ADG83829.1 1-(5-phosphoribosyl)-5-amino-4-imidazole-carboxylate (AIR) carboxylase [Thermincola potens JR]